MLKEFKKFIMKGNVVDLAVGVVIGVAFGAMINSLVANLLTPLITAIAGQPDFSALNFTINNSKFMYGSFINAVVSFISIAAVVFFLVVKPINKLQSMANRNLAKDDPKSKECPECLSSIPKKAKRCMYCTSAVK